MTTFMKVSVLTKQQTAVVDGEDTLSLLLIVVYKPKWYLCMPSLQYGSTSCSGTTTASLWKDSRITSERHHRSPTAKLTNVLF